MSAPATRRLSDWADADAGPRLLPAVVRERPVRLRHLLQVFPTLHRRTEPVARVQQLGGEATRHRLLPPLTRVPDDPTDRERRRPAGAHLDRHLVGGTTDAAGLHL